MNFCRSISLTIAKLWRPEVARHWIIFIFLRFLEKQPLTGEFSKFYSEMNHRNTDRRAMFKFREIWLTETVKIVHIRCALKSESNIRLKRSFKPNNNATQYSAIIMLNYYNKAIKHDIQGEHNSTCNSKRMLKLQCNSIKVVIEIIWEKRKRTSVWG